MAVQVAESPARNMITFNTETDMPDGKYNKFKKLEGFEIGFKSISEWRQQGVGLGLYKDGNVYLLADNHGHYQFKDKVSVESGYFYEDGEWINQYKPNLIKNKQENMNFTITRANV